MKTPEAIKFGLKHCRSVVICDIHCEYYPEKECEPMLLDDALAYIEQLEERIALMKIQMRGDCGTCKHRDDDVMTYDCYPCMTALTGDHPLWEYEGFPGEDTIHEKPV